MFQLMSTNPRYAKFLFQLADLGSQLQISKLRDCACNLLQLIPAGASHDCHMTATCHYVCCLGKPVDMHATKLHYSLVVSVVIMNNPVYQMCCVLTK